jgi:D-beta-D-heptose 7-phosphate kinase/D-beta-D-heptose 1-phosphate adenosyltransferase
VRSDRTGAATPDDVRSLAGRRVVVVGDLMLDTYLVGEVRRISPEAPVPVLEVAESTSRPGGAANTALNIAALGGRPALVGVVGADAEGAQLIALLEGEHVRADAVLRDAARPTTHKTRIVARSQQIVRIDRELRRPVPPALEEQLCAAVDAAMDDADACVLSDYQKGLLTRRLCERAIAAAARRGCPVVVDPKGQDFSPYRGCTVVTPNTHEVEVATGCAAEGDDAVVQAGSRLLESLDGAAILVTRGAAGMTLLRRGQPPRHLSTAAKAVYDVTGAGDTVVGTLALGLAAGLPLERAVDLANRAAGVSVGKMGASTVSPAEIIGALGALGALGDAAPDRKPQD